MKLTKYAAWPVLVLGLSAPLLIDCSAKDLADAAQGCNEFSGGVSAIASLDVDAKVKVALQATADLKGLADAMITDTSKYCAQIATDLGATDTWSAKGDAKSSGYAQEACAQASAKIDAIMKAGVTAGCSFNLQVSGGKCEASFDAQASCDAQCSVDGKCDPGKIEARCTPGELSVKCEGTCAAGATCQGSVTAAANCEGTCGATCEGTCGGECNGTVTGGCSGTCEGKCDGTATPAGGQANCAGTCEGKCSAPKAGAVCKGSCTATCKGTCTGDCKLDATAKVSCGATATCKGTCEGTATAPHCEGDFTPPTCNVDAKCSGACKGSVTAKATCTPPSVELAAACTTSSDDIVKLVATLKANLPPLFVNGVVRGQAAVKLTGEAASAIGGIFSGGASLGGKAVACIAVAAQAHVQASANISVSVSASASASGSASSGGK